MKPLALLLVVMAFVPYWTVLSFTSIPIVYLTLLVVAAGLWRQIGERRVTSVDVLVLLVFVVIIAVAPLYGSSPRSAGTALLQWFLPYVIGRSIGAGTGVVSLSRWFGAWGVVLGAFSAIEFLAGWHPFVAFQTLDGSGDIWSSIQQRGGLARSEWTFGHSISLGNTIALCLPFLLLSNYHRYVKCAGALVMFGGCLVTLSRSGMICFAVGLAVCGFIAVRRSKSPAVILFAIASLVIGLVGLRIALDTFGRADDLGSSSAARFDQLELVKSASWIGPSGFEFSFGGTRVGYALNGGIYSTIDNALGHVALQFGLVATLLLAATLAVACVRMWPQVSDPRVAAFLTLVPSIVVAAFITYYGMIFWLALGLAVTALETARRDVEPLGVRDDSDVLGQTGAPS